MCIRDSQKGIRSNTYDIIPRDQWEVIEGCHEAIVTPEEWQQVQELIDRRPTIQGNSCPFYNLFHGLVYCATCGKSTQVRYEKVGRTGKNRFTGEMREPIDKAYLKRLTLLSYNYLKRVNREILAAGLQSIHSMDCHALQHQFPQERRQPLIQNMPPKYRPRQ